jgi:hypothetical protein
VRGGGGAKSGYGGIAYIAHVLGMSRRTLYSGIRELEAMEADDSEPLKTLVTCRSAHVCQGQINNIKQLMKISDSPVLQSAASWALLLLKKNGL